MEEGNILSVEGKVRLRDDRVQLSCDSVYRYQPEAARAEETVTALTEKVPTVVEETPLETSPTKNRRLVISITQTSDEESDIARLRKLNDIVKDFSGEDEVILRVENGEKVDILRLFNTGYCPELHQRLVELVGEERLKLETLAS